MKDYLFNFKNRLRSPSFLLNLTAWHLLLLKKVFHVSFKESDLSKTESIDVVIASTTKDLLILKETVRGARENVLHNIRNIYIVSPNEQPMVDFCKNNGCTFVDENTVLNHPKGEMSGWIFQQMLKLNSTKFTTEEYFLVIDADTVLLNPHRFIKTGRLIFLESNEWHKPYFDTFKKIFGYKTPSLVSHVAHMMIFERSSLMEMNNQMSPSLIDKNFSEYETYSNWMMKMYPDKVSTKPFYNKGLKRIDFGTLEQLKNKFGKKLNSVSFHSYLSE